MHNLLLIYLNYKPLHVSSGLAANHQEDRIRVLPAASQNNAWLYKLLFIRSWSSWWSAPSLLETCGGLLL